MNPSRQRKSTYHPAKVTAAVLTHLPHEAGFFEHRFAVTRLCLESLIAHSGEAVDIMVFDNGSCPALVSYLAQLRDQEKIDFLILSRQNVGKIAALQMIFKAAPGEYIAYTDDDVYFLPGWLDAHLEIFETYPQTGLVTGFYIRSHMVYGLKSTLRFAENSDVEMQRGYLIPKEDEQHYIDNMGRTWESYEEETRGLEDVLLNYRGVKALVSSGHHQFLAPKDLIREALPAKFGDQLMGKMVELEETVDRMGYLRLSTPRPVTRLLGNVISSEMAKEAEFHGLNVSTQSGHDAVRGKSIYRSKIVRRVAQGIYNRMYKILNT
jgi:glycosyltransferase involved in cell wall biosynthesis